MIRQRSDVQVVTSAGQMDAALEHGIRADVLAELVAARTQWHETGVIPSLTVWALAAVGAPAACEWDAVFVHAVRRGLVTDSTVDYR